MCLYVDRTIHPTIKLIRAKKDIRVYKILSKGNCSIFYRFKWAPKIKAKPKRIEARDRTYGAIASISTDSPVRYYVEEGYHSYKHKPSIHHRDFNHIPRYKSKIVCFYIPKGALYYEGTRGDLVSSSIRSGPLTALKPMDV